MPASEQDQSIGLHVDLDGAAAPAAGLLGLPTLDARCWGPKLRIVARPRDMDVFYEFVRPRLRPLTLFGSGDFHHLSALWLRRLKEPFTLVMFDNHPDWDRRPPRWSCGGWLNRALELPNCRRIVVLGCGNFELEFPSRLFGCSDVRLEIRPWAERVSPRTRRGFRCIDAGSVPQATAELVDDLRGGAVYVSVDLDALAAADAVTNWENGLFSTRQVCSIIEDLGTRARIVGADVCGGYSPPVLERMLQRLAHVWDHPKLNLPEASEIVSRNAKATAAIWNALAAALDRQPGAA